MKKKEKKQEIAQIVAYNYFFTQWVAYTFCDITLSMLIVVVSCKKKKKKSNTDSYV